VFFRKANKLIDVINLKTIAYYFSTSSRLLIFNRTRLAIVLFCFAQLSYGVQECDATGDVMKNYGPAHLLSTVYSPLNIEVILG
jgi:hypothetical protein